jgi:hypothetical protein
MDAMVALHPSVVNGEQHTQTGRDNKNTSKLEALALFFSRLF